MGDNNDDMIDIDLIAEYIIGLKTYEADMDENKVKRYVDFTCSHNEP